MTDIVHIPFSGGEVQAVDTNGKPHVILRPVFEAIGLDADRQIAKLQRQPWASTAVTAVQVGDQRRNMVTADVRTFLMALATIPVSRVSKEAQPLLIKYQAEVADAIEAYWTQGGALNPRATQDQLDAITVRAKAQMDVLAAARGIIASSWLEAKARHVAARALGEEPELDPMARPLTVGEFLEDKGLTAAERRKVGGKLGGRVKGLFIGEHGRMPEQVERFIDGALRPVYAYTEADRPLFELAWSAMSASTRSGR